MARSEGYPGRWIGVDFGRKWVGLSVCDEEGRLASPLKTLEANPRQKLLVQLQRLAGNEEARGFVVGLPLNMDGSEGPAARECRKFAAELKEFTKLEVELQDERLSSWEAEGRLMEAGRRPPHRRSKVHEASATVILEAFLQSRKSL